MNQGLFAENGSLFEVYMSATLLALCMGFIALMEVVCDLVAEI